MNTELSPTPMKNLLEPVPASTHTSLQAASSDVIDRSKRLASATDEYLRTNPWQMLGACTAAGLLIGYLAHRR
jgi:ElaB/YqjD/DUF883 family membrane-anchored ribosome-binding protein